MFLRSVLVLASARPIIFADPSLPTLFFLTSVNAKPISAISRFPEEAEVLPSGPTQTTNRIRLIPSIGFVGGRHLKILCGFFKDLYLLKQFFWGKGRKFQKALIFPHCIIPLYFPRFVLVAF